MGIQSCKMVNQWAVCTPLILAAWLHQADECKVVEMTLEMLPHNATCQASKSLCGVISISSCATSASFAYPRLHSCHPKARSETDMLLFKLYAGKMPCMVEVMGKNISLAF